MDPLLHTVTIAVNRSRNYNSGKEELSESFYAEPGTPPEKLRLVRREIAIRLAHECEEMVASILAGAHIKGKR